MQAGSKQGGVAVMASSQAYLSGGKVNLAILRESYRRELLDCLDKCQGSKVSSCLIQFLACIVIRLRLVTIIGVKPKKPAQPSCSIQQSSCYTCYTCYTEDSCRQAIIDSCQKQLSQISFHALSFQKI